MRNFLKTMRIGSVVCLCLLSVYPFIAGCDMILCFNGVCLFERVESFSDFTTFSFIQEPLCVCPSAQRQSVQSDIVTAEITLDENGEYKLTMAIANILETETDPVLIEDCIEIVDVPPRTLSNEEIAAVKAAFSSIRTRDIVPIGFVGDGTFPIGPCVSVRWDDARYSLIVGPRQLALPEDAQRIVDLMEQLREAS